MASKPPEPQSSQSEDVAVVDAYERRLQARGLGLAAPADGDALGAEVQGYVALHERVARLELPEVAPSVRAVILSAAAQAIEERQRSSGFSQLLAWLLRPGPVVVAMTLAAIAVAVAVRPSQQAPAALGSQAVAMLESAPRPEEAQLPAAAAPPTLPPAQAPAAPEAETAPAPSLAAAQAPPAPLHTIAAQPASLGPAETAVADSPEARRAQAKVALSKPDSGSLRANAPKSSDELDFAADEVAAVANNAAAGKAQRAQAQHAAVAEEQVAQRERGVAEVNAAPMREPTGQAAAAKAGPSYRFQDDLADRTASMAPGSRGANSLGSQVRGRADNEKRNNDFAQAPAPTDNRAEQANTADAATSAGVAGARAEVDKASEGSQRLAALHKLAAAARAAQDAKTEAWANAQIKGEMERAALRQMAQKKAAPAKQPAAARPAENQDRP